MKWFAPSSAGTIMLLTYITERQLTAAPSSHGSSSSWSIAVHHIRAEVQVTSSGVGWRDDHFPHLRCIQDDWPFVLRRNLRLSVRYASKPRHCNGVPLGGGWAFDRTRACREKWVVEDGSEWHRPAARRRAQSPQPEWGVRLHLGAEAVAATVRQSNEELWCLPYARRINWRCVVYAACWRARVAADGATDNRSTTGDCRGRWRPCGDRRSEEFFLSEWRCGAPPL